MSKLRTLFMVGLVALWWASWCGACSRVTDFDRFRVGELELLEHDAGPDAHLVDELERDAGPDAHLVDDPDELERDAGPDAHLVDAGKPPAPAPALDGTWRVVRTNVNTGDCPGLPNRESTWVLVVQGTKVSGSDDGLAGGITGTVSGSRFELDTSTSRFSGVFSQTTLTAAETSDEGDCLGVTRMVSGKRQ